jgi:NTE family protein
MQPIRTLILSGGGGRGAFHAGVYKYLMESDKSGVDDDHQGVWIPDIIVGTSIGAVNGAAIAQGISPEKLEEIWRDLREQDIQGLPPGMKFISRWISKQVLKSLIGVNLPQVPPNRGTSTEPEDFWPPLPILPKWMAEKLIGRWINLLDTGPLLETLKDKFQIDEQLLANRPGTLMITATNVQTGERVIFSNKPIFRQKNGKSELRPDVHYGISLRRIIASCSIPLVYPWTYDVETDAYYWDGALVANTPIGAALDAVRDKPPEIPMEVVVVLMTPWWETGETPPSRASELPDSFDDAITWMLDWMLLASFRERLNLIHIYNDMADLERVSGKNEYHYRKVEVAIIAPQDFFSAARILDYDEYSATLINLGYQSALRVFQKQFVLY